MISNDQIVHMSAHASIRVCMHMHIRILVFCLLVFGFWISSIIQPSINMCTCCFDSGVGFWLISASDSEYLPDTLQDTVPELWELVRNDQQRTN